MVPTRGRNDSNRPAGPEEISGTVQAFHPGPPAGSTTRARNKRGDIHSASKKASGVLQLFRYTTPGDTAVLGIGILFALLHGAGFPFLALVFGQMTNTFISQSVAQDTSPFQTQYEDVSNSSTPVDAVGNTSAAPPWMSPPLAPEDFSAYVSQFSYYYVALGVGVLISSFIQTLCWELTSERQVHHLRRVYFSRILRQDIAWFDKVQGGDVTSILSDDMERIRDGLGSKFSMVVQYMATFFAGLGVGLVVNWQLTVVIMAVGPILIGASAYMAKVTASSASREQLKYFFAGGIAVEVLSSIRTVAAFGGQEREIKRYDAALEEGRWLTMKRYYVMSLGVGLVVFTTYAMYGLAFWYGSQLVQWGLASPGSIFTVFFSVMAGAFSIGNALPFFNAVSVAIGSASNIFNVIDKVPGVDSSSDGGLKPAFVKGHIQFRDVSFRYPTRPDIQVLKHFNLDIEPGKMVALVGSSGGGKSTIVSLLLRFYNPTSGQILLDGMELRHLNVRWLRDQIGVVSQEPTLFGVSILENIRYGRPDITREEIITAAIQANAHDFISILPLGYNTLVGVLGAQLSGGQKQRIAIARALARNPRLLLLDEATSALDSHSEGLVQAALDKATEGRTTLVIAHRLSTIKNADIIYAIKDGSVLEGGTHSTLMAAEGLYHSLVTTQTSRDHTDFSSSGDAGLLSDDRRSSGKSRGQRRAHCRSVSLMSSMSVVDEEIAELQQDALETRSESVDWLQMARFNAPEWHWLTLGVLGCCLTGSVMPIFAYFYGEMFATFTLSGEALSQASVFWMLMFLVLAVISAIGFAMQISCMTTAAEKLVVRLRRRAFANILRQSVGWFDMDVNSPGKLITRLSRDAPLVRDAAGLRAGQVIGSAVTLVAAMAIAFLNGWKLASLLVVAAPLVVGASYQQGMLLRRNLRRDAEFMEEAGRMASECIQNIRTVQALGREQLFCDIYMDSLKVPFKEAKKQAVVFALIFGFSQSVIYLMYAAAYRFGAHLIQVGEMTPTEVYRVFFALAFCAASVGNSSIFYRDYTKAKLAAGLMFDLIRRKSDMDINSSLGIKPVIVGKVAFRDVHFRYPNRPDVSVLRGLNLAVQPGRTLAIVGDSGCGKSTLVALLERFYDPTSGVVAVDDLDIRTVNVLHLRSQMGLVTQEPVLFDCSLRDNIAYGALDRDAVQLADIVGVARAANIHDFIVGLPLGYDTMVGERGTQLSGGQKQRVAIARALIRDPRILILDEATSALDSESEKVVQDALDKARQGRTCIVIAHRLSTIKSADSIAVVHQGLVVEQGTHKELTALRGHYHNLVKLQRF